MSLIDLSQELNHSTQPYPGDQKFTSCPNYTMEKDGCRTMSFTLSSHTGTHIDVPSHFIKDGASVPDVDLALFTGPALVIDVRGKKPRERITWEDLAPYASKMQKGVIVLLHTGWSAYWNSLKYIDHPFLDRTASEGLMKTGVRTVGIDAMSPDETVSEDMESSGDFSAHLTILGAGGVIAENLTNLDAITYADPIVSFFPLKLTDGDGSPVRAAAWSASEQ